MLQKDICHNVPTINQQKEIWGVVGRSTQPVHLGQQSIPGHPDRCLKIIELVSTPGEQNNNLQWQHTIQIVLPQIADQRIDCTDILQALQQILLNQCSTFQAAAASVGIPSTSLHHLLKEGDILARSRSRSIKPQLTVKNMSDCIVHCVNSVNKDCSMFSLMYNVVCINQK